MNKIYGVRIVMLDETSGAVHEEYINWYSFNEKLCAENIEFAKKIPPPNGFISTFEQVCADVTIKTRGTYDLENGAKVFLTYQSGIQMHGYAVVGGKVKTNKSVAFYLNGDPANKKGPRVTGRSRTPAE